MNSSNQPWKQHSGWEVLTGPDMPYKEMAHHCEALLEGKQQKMSNLMGAQQQQECFSDSSLQNHSNEAKGGNPFLKLDFTANPYKPSAAVIPTQGATEHQHPPHLFQLPTSSPYNNFLQAGACSSNTEL